MLSYVGRIQLVNSVFVHMHSYWAAIFVLPKRVLKDVMAVCRNYLWDGKPIESRAPLIAWDIGCRRKDQGDLGIHDCIKWNIAAEGKCIWTDETANHWWKTEDWLRKRYAEVCSDTKLDHQFKVLGYQWRVLRFNGVTRQSAVKVMAASKVSDPNSVYYMQQPHVLAVPYTKSMVSAGLTALSSSSYDLMNAVNGKKEMRVLCVGHGGGSLPLFVASKIQGAVIDVVEIDPVVISTSIQAMGFPSFSVAVPAGHHALSRPNKMDEVLWKGIHERIFLYESDAEKFILNTDKTYDMVFIDAYDGDDIFPRKLWDPDSPFLRALGGKLHPHHGTVVVNLHSDESVSFVHQSVVPMGKYISGVCRAYKNMLVGNRSSSFNNDFSGLGFVVSVPWLCNTTLVVCRGFGVPVGGSDEDSVLNVLFARSHEVDRDLSMPFSCLQYLNRGFHLLD